MIKFLLNGDRKQPWKHLVLHTPFRKSSFYGSHATFVIYRQILDNVSTIKRDFSTLESCGHYVSEYMISTQA